VAGPRKNPQRRKHAVARLEWTASLKRELDLMIEQRINASTDDIRSKARQEADEAARLKVVEKDQTIKSMSRTIEELKRKTEQGSQQAQGEALEASTDPEEKVS